MSRSLPASLDAVTGLRAARWFRESTSGQFDNFGPDAQREQQDLRCQQQARGNGSRLIFSIFD